ncbi:MAG: hypothetical protein WCL46_10195 [Chlorobium sp.]
MDGMQIFLGCNFPVDVHSGKPYFSSLFFRSLQFKKMLGLQRQHIRVINAQLSLLTSEIDSSGFRPVSKHQ